MDTFEILKKTIADVSGADPEEITPETSFDKDLGLDSLDRYQIFLDVSDALSINKEADNDALMKIATVQDAVDYIESLK